jgi:hypothetical protein
MWYAFHPWLLDSGKRYKFLLASRTSAILGSRPCRNDVAFFGLTVLKTVARFYLS